MTSCTKKTLVRQGACAQWVQPHTLHHTYARTVICVSGGGHKQFHKDTGLAELNDGGITLNESIDTLAVSQGDRNRVTFVQPLI